jgi:choice-of-anchor B domain-containing protein
MIRFALFVCLFAGSVSSLHGHDQEGEKSIANSAGAGIGGNGPYDSRNVNLLSRLGLDEMHGGPSNVLGNDVWGWTDSLTGREYAIMGMTDRTSFVDVTDPTAPTFLGSLASHTGNRTWRDMKVFNDRAYIVADSNGEHGMQIFDLTQLRSVTSPQNFSSTAHYDGFNRAHNISINEDSGFAYVVGSEVASGGLHVLDLNGSSFIPTLAGEFADDGYTHDTQVVNYSGPDSDYANREVAFNSNEDTLTIVDVTDKSNMTEISRAGYDNANYAHQGWLSEDHKYFFMDDELDERNSDELIQTTTRVWDVQDLDNPEYLGSYDGVEATIDHNLYVKDGIIYQANYTSGLRMLRINDASTLDLEEIGFFDTYNTDNNVSFNGAWSVYPFFESGTILVSDRQNGLFMLQAVPEPGTACVVGVLLIGLVSRRRRMG